MASSSPGGAGLGSSGRGGEDNDEEVRQMVERLKQADIYNVLRKQALNEAASGSPSAATGGQVSLVQPSPTQFMLEVHEKLDKSGLSKHLANSVYRQLKSQSPTQGEPLGYIRRAQLLWEKRILKSLNQMCTELSVPLARKRGKQEQIELKTKWNEIGTSSPNLEQYRPVYAPKDFLEVIVNLGNPNSTQSGTDPNGYWGMVQVNVNPKCVDQLKKDYFALGIEKCQAGLDDKFTTSHFSQDREQSIKKVIRQGYSLTCELITRQGNPVGQRAAVWERALGVSLDEVDRLYYGQLKSEVILHDLMIDNIIFKDIKLTSVNDDFFFVFEDYLYQVLLIFLRDTTVLKLRSQNVTNPLKAYLRGKLGMENYCVVYPPNGVIPFHGFSMYVAPLCFMYADPIKLYFVFREMYCRYFCHLHCLSSHPKGILAISALFESIVMSLEPQLFFHLKSIGAPPLKMAFKWLMRAFSGYLEADQLLTLWDRMIAYDTTEIFAILAAGIFLYRCSNLMSVTSSNAADAILADLSTVKVIPVIQVTLGYSPLTANALSNISSN